MAHRANLGIWNGEGENVSKSPQLHKRMCYVSVGWLAFVGAYTERAYAKGTLTLFLVI